MHIGSPWRGLLPIPDGTLGQGDRQHVLFLCTAVLADVAQAPTVFGDLTTLFSNYAWNTLRDANPTETDTNTLIRDDLATVIAGTSERADRNTMYAEYLS